MTTDQIDKKFGFEHLAHENLKTVSRHFHALAHWLNDELHDCDEKDQALRDLWAAKNNAVWACMHAEPTE